jgi:CYTH domain-containing protein
MAKEIERKFLVEKDLWYAVKKPKGIDMLQTYLVNEPDKVIRLRIANQVGYMTIKGPVVGFTRDEFEYTIPVEEAKAIVAIFNAPSIEKVRYRIFSGPHTWEVDEFFGANDGLIIAEIELKSQEEDFTHPSWLGKEVTQDHRYYNSYLSLHPYLTW